MVSYDKKYGVIVIGAGHAGCEAALASSRLGIETLLLTINLDTVAQMSCNPAIGGLAKGHIVREIDALGGEMAKVTDLSYIQFRMLNMSKGPAVWAPRAQCDKKIYQFTMKHVLEQQVNLDIKQELVEEILIKNNKVYGIKTQTGLQYFADSVIVTTGTSLKGLIHMGLSSFSAGRAGEFSSENLSDNLRSLGFSLGRLKTGTPARVNRNSLDLSKFDEQITEKKGHFSFWDLQNPLAQIPCYIAYTNQNTHDIIQNNLDRSPLYSGVIKGTGPRYCPSIEDKIVRFPDKTRHQIFIEPEGLDTEEMYLNGLPTSLPQDVQIKMLKSIKGFENIEIMRYGYAIEYDYCNPTQLKSSLETKRIENLFFAGQINGTSGYEEAAAQGLMAGINAVQKLHSNDPLILNRSESYIGVLIDDLVTKGTQEPYRMFTSRAEFRLLLRQDNADIRLSEYGYKVGLLPKTCYEKTLQKEKEINELISTLNSITHEGVSLARLLKRPEITIQEFIDKQLIQADEEIAQSAQTEIKYEGYIKRELSRSTHLKRMENKVLPESIDYTKIRSMRKETIEKLIAIKPRTIGQASRISGIFAPDISLLLIYLESKKSMILG